MSGHEGYNAAEVVGALAMLLGDGMVGSVRLLRWRAVSGAVDPSTVRLRFWPQLLWGVGMSALVVGSSALAAGGHLEWLTIVGGVLGATGWTGVFLFLRAAGPVTLVYDPDTPGL